VRLIAVLGVVLLCLAVPALAGGAKMPLSGTYTVTLAKKVPAELKGAWTISIAPTGRYGIYKSGRKLVVGSARAAGKRVTFVDQAGPAACRGAQALGVYRWKKAVGQLTLTPLSEQCAGRRIVLSSRPLRRR
jgi:hypothetical protein